MPLLSGQRGHKLHLLDVRNLSLSFSRAVFTIGDPVKTTKPGIHKSVIDFLAYAPDRRLYIITVLKEYLQQTIAIRGKATTVFVTLKTPHVAASRDTLRRWIKDAMTSAGIDTTIFKPHSIRGESTSFAARSNLSLECIIKSAGWYRPSTFTKYYNKAIHMDTGDHILMAYIR